MYPPQSKMCTLMTWRWEVHQQIIANNNSCHNAMFTHIHVSPYNEFLKLWIIPTQFPLCINYSVHSIHTNAASHACFLQHTHTHTHTVLVDMVQLQFLYLLHMGKLLGSHVQLLNSLNSWLSNYFNTIKILVYFFSCSSTKILMKKLIAYTCLHKRYTDNKIPAGSVPYLNVWSIHRHAVVLVWRADTLPIYGYVVTTLR